MSFSHIKEHENVFRLEYSIRGYSAWDNLISDGIRIECNQEWMNEEGFFTGSLKNSKKYLEAVAIFVAGVWPQPVQESIHPNNTGPTARLTARR